MKGGKITAAFSLPNNRFELLFLPELLPCSGGSFAFIPISTGCDKVGLKTTI